MSKTFLTIVLLVFAISMIAQPVTEKQAAQVATNFLSAKSGASKAPLKLVYTKSNKQSVLYRVYSNASSFVIVTGDTRCKPILGYSTEGAFVLPPKDTKEAYMSNYWSFMDARAEEIDYAIQQDISPAKSISNQWTDLSRTDYSSPKGSLKSSVSALLSTIWDQDLLYNDSTPNNALAGCVPVAMAQVLKYHYEDETTATQGFGRYAYSTYHANFGNTNYNFHTMPNNHANSDVVQLIYHCGVACHAEWGATSNAETNVYGYDPIMNALVNYFKMSYSTIEHVEKSNYSDANWYTLIKSELNDGRPVLYRGANSSGGHIWVCDGYDDSSGEYFHMNWGWGGSSNGNYLLTSSLQGYNQDQMMVIGIQRADLETVPSTITSNTTWTTDQTFTTSVAVADGFTLTIDPGVTVSFAQDCELRIFGTLDAQGTSSDSIIFTATNQSNGWEGLRWDDDFDDIRSGMSGTVMNDNDSSYLHYARVEYSKSSGLEVSYFDRLELDNCEIRYNETDLNGGGLYLLNSDIIVKNSLINYNSAASGGGFHLSGDVTIQNNRILNNSLTSTNYGGGVYVADDNIRPFIGNIISNNEANYGAAIHLAGKVDIANTTIINNLSTSGSAIFVFSGGSNSTFTNSIIYNNSNSNNKDLWLLGASTTISIDYCLLENGNLSHNGSLSPIYSNYLAGSPLIIDSTLNQGYDTNAVDANFGLDSASRCIDAGTTSGISGLPTYDIIGNPRQNGTIDIGAYEFDLGTYLPIELLSFQASKSGQDVLLSWTTATEINNDYFVLEHSTDAKHFTEIASLPSQNPNSTSLLRYEYSHLSPVDGINYYRLKQVDFDGKYTYSDIRAVAFGAQVEYIVSPNPSRDGMINIVSTQDISRVCVYTTESKLIYDSGELHDTQLNLDLQDIPKGVYFVRIFDRNYQMEIKKIVLL